MKKSNKTDPFESFTDKFHPLIDACEKCDIADFCETDIHIPPCILNKAGMTADADLAVTFYNGCIIIADNDIFKNEDGDHNE